MARYFAFASETGFARFTNVVAGATIGVVGLDVDTIAFAIGKTLLAREFALAFGADFAGGAYVFAFSTVGSVALKVDAGI